MKTNRTYLNQSTLNLAHNLMQNGTFQILPSPQLEYNRLAEKDNIRRCWTLAKNAENA